MKPEEIISLIKSRRSVRSYNDKTVDSKLIEQILDVARWAPSAGNQQPLRIIVVTEKEKKEKIVDATYNQSFFTKAPYVLIVCSDPKDTEKRYKNRGRDLYQYQDTAASIQNMLLTAVAYGLSSCWIGAFKDEIISEIFQLPDNVKPVAILPIGYSDNSVPEGPGRRDLSHIIYAETYSSYYFD